MLVTVSATDDIRDEVRNLVLLLSDRCTLRSDFEIQTCHQDIAEGCLRYLLYVIDQALFTKGVVDQHSLAQYAAEYWWQHTQESDGALGCVVFNLALRLLTEGSAALLSWVQLYNIDRPWRDPGPLITSNDVAQPLYYVASVGVSEVVEEILQLSPHVNVQGGGTMAMHCKQHHGVVMRRWCRSPISVEDVRFLNRHGMICETPFTRRDLDMDVHSELTSGQLPTTLFTPEGARFGTLTPAI